MATTPIKILLFEDDLAQATLTKDALEHEGFAVDICQTGRDGIDRLFNDEYHVYLIDMKLPDIHGFELLRRINALKPGSVSIVVTGHGDELAAVEAMKLGASNYVVKSIDMSHLVALPLLIREGLERRHLRDERERLQTEVWEHARLLEERNAELRRMNEELKRLDQLKSDLISMVSHELRTPLATIKEFTAILTDQIAGPITDDQRGHLSIIMGNVDRLSRIVDDLLDMAKIEAGRVVLTKQVLSLDAIMEHVMQSMRPLADSKRLTLECRAPAEAPEVFADADKVTQVLLNLISNAIKFTEGPGRITMRVEEQANEIHCSVADSGVGIAAEDLPKLFEKFSQLRRIPSLRGATGTGLGLAISKRLVELHGGRIWAISKPGQGSTFTFTLPRYHVEEVFHEHLRAGIEQAKRKQSCFSIILVSLQNFQELKARHGIEAVSRLLKSLETVLRQTVRKRAGDIVIRWQRGEVVVILAEVDRAGSQAIATRMKRIAEEKALRAANGSMKPCLMTTTATYPEDAVTEAELLGIAERRLAHPMDTPTRIMVVDDEAHLRTFIKEVLESRDYEVTTAASGPEALTQLKSRPVDLILLDLAMPVMDGYELYHLLKETPQTKDIPVLIVTGRGERRDRQLGLEAASYNYLTKPFELEELLAKVREILQHSSSNP